jgi:hypothetical protein
MSQSFAEALVSVASRMPRVVNQYEVLRIAGELPGSDAELDARTAINEALVWARKQVGTNLPKEAWEGESFDLPLPGRDPSAIRLRTATSDLWCLRLHRPDRDVAGRAWTTEVVLGHIPGQKVRFSTRLVAATDEANLDILPAVPGLVRQIAQKCGLRVGTQPIASKPLAVQTHDGAAALIDHLIDPGRILPTFVLTCSEKTMAPSVDADALGAQLLGLAHVVVAQPDACWMLTEQLGKRLSVFGGAVRVYQPGFDEASDPFAHRLVLGATLVLPEAKADTEAWLRRLAALHSLNRTRLGHDVLTFTEIRSASLQARQAAIPEAATASEKLKAANESISALNVQLAELKNANDKQFSQYTDECERAEAAEAGARAAARRIQHLIAWLRAAGGDPDEGIALPDVWKNFAAWCESQFAGRLVLAPSARRAIRKAEFGDPPTAARCLLWLATEARDRFIHGGGSISNVGISDGLQNAPCGADTFTFDWEGQSCVADWHVKNGGNTRDPVRCLRIYYGFDEQTQQIVVAQMPDHRRTGAT